MNRPARLVFFLFCLLLSAASCVPERCKDVVCLNGGLCVDGRCSCPQAYEGPLCEQRWHEKFAGLWRNEVRTIDASSDISTATYRIFVRPADSAHLFLIDSLGGFDGAVVCELSGSNSFRFRSQYSADSSLYIEAGQGSLDTLTGVVTAGYVYKVGDSPRRSEMKWAKEP
jgi:hypothetical protein